MFDFLIDLLSTTVSFIIFLISITITIIAWYRLFEKAGVDGWKAIIPIYNIWCYYKIATNGINTWIWFFGPLILGWIPIIGWIITAISYLYINYKFAKRYTNNDLLIILHLIPAISPIIKLIFAFGDYGFDNKKYETNF